MAAETILKFPYGETPEAVIRERAGLDVALEVSRYDGYADNPVFQGSPDDLITVLDALHERALHWAIGENERAADEYRHSAATPDRCDAGRLRIDILAALGIKESATLESE